MTKLLRKTRALVGLALAWVLFACSHAFPRSRRIWVFVGWHRLGQREFLADNAKYLFLFASQRAKSAGIRPVWLSSDSELVEELRARGYRAYRERSIGGIFFALRAGYTFIDSNMRAENWQLSGGTRRIQLWHGVPTKLIGYQSPNRTVPSRMLSPNWHARPHMTVSTSETYSRIMIEAFHTDAETLRITGYPRNDVILSPVPDSDIGTTKLPPASGQIRQMLLYAPTFRPDGTNPLQHINLPRMYAFLKEHDAAMYFSLHPKLAGYRPQWDDRFAERMHFIDGGSDIYPHLHMFNACITDYSSTATDFLLIDRPVIYYRYDSAQYELGTGFQECEGDLTPGPRVKTFDELLSVLSSLARLKDDYADKRKRARECAFAQQDARSSERVLAAVLADAGIIDPLQQ